MNREFTVSFYLHEISVVRYTGDLYNARVEKTVIRIHELKYCGIKRSVLRKGSGGAKQAGFVRTSSR